MPPRISCLFRAGGQSVTRVGVLYTPRVRSFFLAAFYFRPFWVHVAALFSPCEGLCPRGWLFCVDYVRLVLLTIASSSPLSPKALLIRMQTTPCHRCFYRVRPRLCSGHKLPPRAAARESVSFCVCVCLPLFLFHTINTSIESLRTKLQKKKKKSQSHHNSFEGWPFGLKADTSPHPDHCGCRAHR